MAVAALRTNDFSELHVVLSGNEGFTPARRPVSIVATRHGAGQTLMEDPHVSRLKALKKQMIALLPRLRRFACVLTRSEPDADDLVQETCLRAMDRADQWDPAQPLDRWLFRIARNLWFSELRKRKVRVGEGQIPAEEADELTSGQTPEGDMQATDILQAIRALPEDQGSLLLVVSVEGYSYDEAAALFDIPKGTVMSRLYRARKALSEQLADVKGTVA